MFWIITTALVFVALLFIFVPLWRRRNVDSFTEEELRKAANIALFHERSNELEAEYAAGALEQSQFDSLMAELQQKLLRDVSDDEIAATRNKEKKSKQASVSGKSGSRLNFAVPAVLALLIPLASYFLYQQWGYLEDVRYMELFERTVNNRDNAQEATALIVALGEAVQANEDLPWGWYFLGENFANIGMFNEAQIAYERAASLLEPNGEKAMVLGRVAMSRYINAEFAMTAAVEQAIEEARDINPNETSVLQLLAADAEQKQDYEAAIRYWRLLIQNNPNSPQADTLRSNIAAAQQALAEANGEVTPGPTVRVRLALADGLEIDPALRVYVAARNAEREGMPPLAVATLTVGQLPAVVELDNSSAVGPFNLASADTVNVSALVSQAGDANPSPGDWRVISDNFAHNGQTAEIELTISEQVQ